MQEEEEEEEEVARQQHTHLMSSDDDDDDHSPPTNMGGNIPPSRPHFRIGSGTRDEPVDNGRDHPSATGPEDVAGCPPVSARRHSRQPPSPPLPHPGKMQRAGHNPSPAAGASLPHPPAPSPMAMPASASTPVTSHFDAMLECLDLISAMEKDCAVDKQDVIDSIRSMLNNMLSTVLTHNFATSMSVQGWRVL